AGQKFTVMESSRARFGVVICFEVIFPDLVRKFVKQGAQFMATLTNDAWFGRSSAPYQHFSMVVFRAVENRVPFIRAANTGITGSIDATGRIQGTTDLFIKTYLVQEINLKSIKSFYTQYGDLFAYLCGIIALVTIMGCLWRERSHARGI
ncbi:MAG: apolipoprotein N-acyltransferase, partial [Nitrospira sp.]|nr:apolipoprotein N-acyltransferase [Nitrospira sp.]